MKTLIHEDGRQEYLSQAQVIALSEFSCLPDWQCCNQRFAALEELQRCLKMGVPEYQQRTPVYKRVCTILKEFASSLVREQQYAMRGDANYPPRPVKSQEYQQLLIDMEAK